MADMELLSQLGWKPFFQQQLSIDEWESATIVRIVGQHRLGMLLQGEAGRSELAVNRSMPELVVGDWLLLDGEGNFVRLLDRFSLFSRKAAGHIAYEQLITANVDTLFIVTSLNEDFNLSRIERYLTMANEAGVEPVLILSKSDLCDAPELYIDEVREVEPTLQVVFVNCLDAESVKQLDPWCEKGKTVALLGSSGVGKSTLVNTLLGAAVQQTNEIREDDAKGRHTTTSRSIHQLSSGGLLIDSPGMRELQLTDCEAGVEETFAEIAALATQCKFNDCQHQSEPGCAINAAIEADEVDIRRVDNYLKLIKEQETNASTIAQKRERDRRFGRHLHNYKKSKRKR